MEALCPVILAVPARVRRLRGAPKARALSGLAREALTRSAALSGLFPGPLRKRDNGAPLPAGGVFWSITHKDTFVGGVAARHPIGIDLEEIRPVAEGMYARIAAPDEWRLAGEASSPPPDALQTFFRFWTAKEAVLKAAGKGLAGLAGCRIRGIPGEGRLTLSCAGRTWEVAHHVFGGHMAALVHGGQPVSWTVTSL